MNKTAIKNFAIWARNKLIAEIQYKAGLLGITEKEIKNPLPQSTQTVQFFDIGTKEPYSLTGVEIAQRRKLAEEIQRKAGQSDYKTAYKTTVEEVAYTWFNRLIAVRFMEINDYLPSRVRVLSSESANKTEPDLVTSPMDAELDYTPYEKDRILQLKHENKLDELFRLLFIKQCNALNTILPELFEKTNDFTELLLNVTFTDQDGVMYHLVHDIPEDDFNVSKEGQVEILGWLYQYYNTEPKDETFALLKKNVKITKERIPSATQLFTPDWIVRYMVENSLGRLWLEGHPNDALKSGWKYYLDEAEQEAEVQAQLAIIREEYKTIKPADIKVIDPCMGSGHIMVYAFEVLMQIYESCGYSQRDAAKSILENNLFGLDIDNRAYQLAYFAVLMKARQYNRRILDDEIKCNVYAIQESNDINREQLKYFGQGMNELERNVVLPQMDYLLDTLQDAKEYGSILNVEALNWALMREFVNDTKFHGQMSFDTVGLEDTQEQLRQLVEIAAVMAQKYDVVVTNPPYMGSSGMSLKVGDFVKQNYPESKSDFCAIFIEKCIDMVKPNRKISMVTMQSWMFLSSLEMLRQKIVTRIQIETINHLGMEAFDGIIGKVVATVAFCLNNSSYLLNYRGTAVRLTNFYDSQRGLKESEYFKSKNRYRYQQQYFSKIPGMRIAYWISETILSSFDGKSVDDYAAQKVRISTGNNNKFIRLWHEIIYSKMYSPNKWVLYNKGGKFRKWYGNFEYVINYENDGFEIKAFEGYSKSAEEYYLRKGLTWTDLSTGKVSFRYLPQGMISAASGPMLHVYSDSNLFKLLGILNSVVSQKYVSFLCPTLHFQWGEIAKIPIRGMETEAISEIAGSNTELAKLDWDFYETSWGFMRHPLLTCKTIVQIADAFYAWKIFAEKQFDHLKANEEELNRILIKIYGLQDELTPEVADKDVTIRKADIPRDIRSFLSYAVGCIFGRYSLDIDGIAYAGGEWDAGKYSTFIPDKDNILPITDEEYFADDVVGLFCSFLKKTFGPATLEENLDFIAKALGNKGNSSREIIRNYFLKDFFKDHCKVYQKRPIYWLFDSGKADGFKALIYLHRYNADTIGNLRIDYLHRLQRVYESEISRMQETMDNSKDAREVSIATKRKEKLVKQLKETKAYDEKIAHLALARIELDLDDGVVVNYEKVQTGTDGKKLEVLAGV